MLNDLLTLTKIREGDIKAFEDVFRRYYSPLCWYAMSTPAVWRLRRKS